MNEIIELILWLSDTNMFSAYWGWGRRTMFGQFKETWVDDQNLHIGKRILRFLKDFILRKYYEDETLLSLSGRACKMAKNPFRNHSCTLLLEEIDGCFLFRDSADPSFNGNPFDFAALYFKTTGQELFRLN